MQTMRKVLLLAVILIGAFVLYIGLSPFGKMNDLERIVHQDETFTKTFTMAYHRPEFTDMVRSRGYKEALLTLAGQDSIGLIINLKDSVVALSINGVTIHETQVRSMSVDPMLTKLPADIYLKLFSQPLPVMEERATIVKEPIVVREAPRDTIEASLNAYKPDTLIQNPAFLQLKLEHGITLVFEQDRNETLQDHWVWLKFRMQEWSSGMQKGLIRFVQLKGYDYQPAIRIKMPVNDLRAVYRALPDQPYVVVRY